MTAIELDAVTRTYPPDVTALDRISFDVEPGELVGIVGRSGSGKSTLLNIMGTLDTPTAGSIRIDGADTRGYDDRELTRLRATSLGFVFQSFHLDETLTAARNVATGLLYAGFPRKGRDARAREALERVGLADRADHRPLQLSGGQRQRVAIARAIVKEPALVLADEPTGALDAQSGDLIVELLLRLNSEGTTIALITHDATIADRLPRTVTLADGRLIGDTGRPDGSEGADAANKP